MVDIQLERQTLALEVELWWRKKTNFFVTVDHEFDPCKSFEVCQECDCGLK